MELGRWYTCKLDRGHHSLAQLWSGSFRGNVKGQFSLQGPGRHDVTLMVKACRWMCLCSPAASSSRRQSFRRGASEANAACLQIKVPRRAAPSWRTGDAAAHPLDVLVFEFQRTPRTFLDMPTGERGWRCPHDSDTPRGPRRGMSHVLFRAHPVARPGTKASKSGLTATACKCAIEAGEHDAGLAVLTILQGQLFATA